MADHDTFHVAGCILRFLARSAETGGAYCFVEALVAPGAGAPPNRHPGETESFYVLDGAFEFVVAGEARRVGPGGFVALPDGAVHTFRNVGEAPARLLIVNAPGRMHDLFFSEAGDPVPAGADEFPDGPPDVAKLLAAAERAGMEIIREDAPAP